MNNLLYTYAFMEVLYNRGDDYIDSYWPFVVSVLPRDKTSASISDIQTFIREKYGPDLPAHSLNVIITRAKRKGLIRQISGTWSLTDEGIEYSNTLESEREAESRINELVEDARIFIQKDGLALTFDQTRDLLLAFLGEHISLLEGFIGPDRKVLKSDFLTKSEEIALLRYFAEVERAKPRLFNTLRDIVCGSLLSTIVHSSNLPETTRAFQRTRIYLDTNIILSLLNLTYAEFSKPVFEMHRLMQDARCFEFRVFDFTIDEVVGLLGRYTAFEYKYSPDIKVGSVYSSLKANGWTPAKVRGLIADLEQNLKSLDIITEATDIKISDSSVIDQKDRDILKRYKPEQKERNQNHDLFAIDRIAAIRAGDIRRIEESRALFLTSDGKLAQYAQFERGHLDRATVSEVILDRVMTNILWLKKPKLIKSIPLHLIIAMHSRHLFIDKKIWGAFYDSVQHLKSSGTIVDREIAILLYDLSIRDALLQYEPEDVNKIQASWVLERLDNAKKRIESEKSSAINEQITSMQKEQVDSLIWQESIFEQKISKAEEDLTRKFLELLDRQKLAIKEGSKKQAKKYILILKLIIAAVMIVILVKALPTLLPKWVANETYTGFIIFVGSVLVTGLGIKWNPGDIWQGIEEKMFEKIYNRNLAALHMPEFK